MSSETQPQVVIKRPVMYDRKGRIYEPAVNPRLKALLVLIFVLFALISANSVYLVFLKVLSWWTGQELGNWFYLQMFFWHVVLGVVVIVPFIVFVAGHLRAALKRPNRQAVRLGFGLLISSLIVLATGIVMVFQRQLFSTTSLTGQMVYWLHALVPLAIIGFYLAHRMAGPVVKWRYAGVWGGALAVILAGLGLMHSQDPRQWGVKGAGDDYFQPSSARTINAEGQTGTHFIPEYALMNNDYCLKCHEDAYHSWFHSAHRFSSFNNLPYRQSILDMRKAIDKEVSHVALRRNLNEESDEFKKYRSKRLQATRWCAGCHDPVPFFSGKFDDDSFFRDLEVHLPIDGSKWQDPSLHTQPTAHAGLTCIACHGITHINSVKGNGDYTIQQPLEYPFQNSQNKLLQFGNEYLVKAKPDLHKKAMLKDFHRSSEFCNVCHKVSLPFDVNNYKWTRGQNHYDSWHNSGASGFAARSFYHPPTAKKCSDCHMPLIDSQDFGNIQGQIHNHLFLGANTGLPSLRMHLGQGQTVPRFGDEANVIRMHQEFLKDKKLRVDLFALRENAEIDGKLHVLRPGLPELAPGQSYLLEIVVRNQGVGHEFSQGTIDSNEIWADVRVQSGGKLLAASGLLDEHGYNDAWAHTLNAVVLDRHGNRIDRRNAKDIFVPLFNHQIPPSSSQVIHYRLTVPKDQVEPLTLAVRINYRKFDRLFQDFFMGRLRGSQAGMLLGASPLDHAGLFGPLRGLAFAKAHDARSGPELPISVLTEDQVTLPVRGGAKVATTPGSTGERPPLWERFNDYGVGLLLAGNEGAEKGLLTQAVEAFTEVTRLRPNDYADGFLNLARVHLKEGDVKKAALAVEQAKEIQPGYFKTAWLRGELNMRLGRLDEAVKDFRQVLDTRIPERGFDFSKDREIRRTLAATLFLRAQNEAEGSPEKAAGLREAEVEFQAVLKIDPEDRDSHLALERLYRQLGDTAKAEHHRREYETYQIDDNARSHAVNVFRRHHRWADKAGQSIVIYELRSPGMPGDAPAKPVAAGK
jgi:tetratricopeptide (TPR) repeat protein